jgi:hypothetical protein
MEHRAELIPRRLVDVLKSDGVQGPLCTCRVTELLFFKQCLLELKAVKESELRLGHMKPMVSFERAVVSMNTRGCVAKKSR